MLSPKKFETVKIIGIAIYISACILIEAMILRIDNHKAISS